MTDDEEEEDDEDDEDEPPKKGKSAKAVKKADAVDKPHMGKGRGRNEYDRLSRGMGSPTGNPY